MTTRDILELCHFNIIWEEGPSLLTRTGVSHRGSPDSRLLDHGPTPDKMFVVVVHPSHSMTFKHDQQHNHRSIDVVNSFVAYDEQTFSDSSR